MPCPLGLAARLRRRGRLLRGLALRLLDRGLSADPARAITRNRQPGRCCVQGCMVPLPDPKVISLQKKKA